MKTYESPVGESISEIVECMVALAKKMERIVTVKFNNIALAIKPSDNPDAIVQYY